MPLLATVGEPSPPRHGIGAWRIGAILAVATLFRVGVAAWPVLSHPDELWQYLEPARHLAVGPWVETWEFRGGVRSWLVPVMLSGPMALGHALAPLSRLDVLLARLLCAVIAVLGIASSIGLGARLSALHGVVVGIATATWFELVYLGPRTAAEPIATALAVIAALLLLRRESKRLALAGLLIGLGCAIRLHYAPALAVLVVIAIGVDARKWRAVIAGMLAGLAVSAAADAAMGATPFVWAWRSVAANIVEGKAASYGVAPFWWYAQEAWHLYGPGVVALVVLAGVGGRRYPHLLGAAVVDLLVHSLIAHKEYRFIFLSTELLVILAAIGSCDLWVRFRPVPNRFRPAAVIGAAWVCWSIASAGLGTAAATWGGHGRLIAAWQIAGDVPDVCGVAVDHIGDLPTASYALFGRDAPIYQYDDRDGPAATRSRAFNVLIVQRANAAAFPGFGEVACDELAYFCVYRRAGDCVRTAGDRRHEENAFLRRRGI